MAGLLRRFHTRVSAALRVIRGGRLSPSKIGASVAIGLFVGCLPLYGLHLPIILGLCLLLRLDLLVAYGCANISVPPMIPLLLFASAQIGGWILVEQVSVPGLAEVDGWRMWELGRTVFVGSVALGGAIGSAGGAVAFALARRWENSPSSLVAGGPNDSPVVRVSRRYEAAPPAHRHYVWFKLRTDPLAQELLEATSGQEWGKVLDAGCGRGQFAWLLKDHNVAQTLAGFDVDEKKVRLAQQAGRPGEEAHFFVGDLRTASFAAADAILFLDVLHYLSEEDQLLVLQRASACLPPGGTILVRETQGRSTGSLFARFFERCGRLLRVNQAQQLAFMPAERLAQELGRLGLSVEQLPGRGPLNNSLVLAKKELERLE